ncbi:MAG: hypothetical protein K5924_05660 [Chloroflexi bacterium]|nr:hypothetical protein [Chloroflexota bacterium]
MTIIVLGSVALGAFAANAAAPALSYSSILETILPPSSVPDEDPASLNASTFGLVLSAAVAAGDDAEAREAKRWLLGNARLGGWGVPYELDAFGDGTVTPSGTPFALSTALALDGLLDAGISGPEIAMSAAIVKHWAESAWSSTDAGGFFWFSLAEHDAFHVPSGSAMMAGVTARMLAEYPEAFESAERRLLESRVADTFAELAEMGPAMRWPYQADRATPSDLRQHVNVLWGGERARDAGFAPPWTRRQAIDSIEQFRHGTGVAVWPDDVEMTADLRRRRVSAHWTAGIGAADAFTGTWGGPGYDADLRVALGSSVGRPDLTAYALLAVAIDSQSDR